MKGIEGSKLGRYELRRRIAQGGMSEVYLGYDRRVRRRVAVKVLYGSSEPFVRRFEREALAVGALSHDHILPLYDFGEQRPWYYLVMPFIEGGTLRDYLQMREKLTLEEAGSFLEQIAAALQHAHDHGVVHRDVKPSNILLRLDGHAYLVDFGLAKAKEEAESLSHAGSMIGTPEYMAPEQSNGINDYRSDVYSLGIILYQMLTGRVPFIAESPVAVTLKHIQHVPPSPSQLNADIPRSIEDVILKALAKDPAERYQEATTFSAAYKTALEQERRQRQDKDIRVALAKEGKVDLAVERAVSQQSDEQGATVEAVTGKLQLFPLDYEVSPLSVDDNEIGRRGKRRAYLLAAVLCFFLLSSMLAFSLMGKIATTPGNRVVRTTPGATSIQRATATALVQANLQATLAAGARVQATAGITSAIGAGNMLYYDDMISAGGGWINDGLQCYFSPQGYHVFSRIPRSAAWCYTNLQQFSDAIITVQARLIRGDIYGLIFRLNPYSKAFYALEMNSQGQYRFQRALSGNTSRWLTIIDWTPSSAIHSGYGQQNTLLIIAAGRHFRFYINQQLLDVTISDPMYTTGLIGLLVGGDSRYGSEAIFTHVAVFEK